MKHLEFAKELENYGCRFSSTTHEGKERIYEMPGVFKSHFIKSKNFILEYTENYTGSPIEDLLALAVDMGGWKHSWHMEMKPENYEKIEEIIQGRILDRAKEVDTLLSIYFQLHHEMSKTK